MEVGIVVCHHDWVFIGGRVTSHPFLVVNLSGINRTCVRGSSLILGLVLDHVVLDGSGKISWHKGLRVALTVLCEEELAEADRRRYLSFETELDQIECVEGWESRVTLINFAIDEVFTKLHSESVSHKLNFQLIGHLNIGVSRQEVLIIFAFQVFLLALLSLTF